MLGWKILMFVEMELPAEVGYSSFAIARTCPMIDWCP